MSKRKNNIKSSSNLAQPQSRTEGFLAKIAGLVETMPEGQYSRLERYLAIIAEAAGSGFEPTTEQLAAINSGATEELIQAIPEFTVNPNLIDNWYLVGGGSQQGGEQFPINQRGQTMYDTGRYGIDRWSSLGRTVPISILPTGVQISNGGQIFQYFEFSRMIAGRIYTMSAIVDNVVYSTTFLYTATDSEVHFIRSGNCNFAFYYNLFNNGSNAIGWNNVTSDVTISAVKLELGDKQTLAHQDANGNWVLNEVPNFQQELEKCQRYYVSTKYNTIIGNKVYGGEYVRIPINFPVEMRAVPSIGITGSAYIPGWGEIAVDKITPYDNEKNGFAASVSVSDLIEGTIGCSVLLAYWASADL